MLNIQISEERVLLLHILLQSIRSPLFEKIFQIKIIGYLRFQLLALCGSTHFNYYFLNRLQLQLKPPQTEELQQQKPLRLRENHVKNLLEADPSS